ncbi:hypothetical protein D8674_017424 [Pyrus ussuriensis x Pyrus communis]|uniref:Uncharacterized protein n=1 Tax=Pyrus ussuriensis x Pyrus communis TaxID=2448454 RepID=A0A5N5HQX7_9ROSA|nr:hypothetical protein D8674_017424 [Pyrus ussuriensis x Pyrus communis]
MSAAKEIEKFILSEAYNHALGDEGFEIFHHYTMKMDVNRKWATVNYYKVLVVGATRQG